MFMSTAPGTVSVLFIYTVLDTSGRLIFSISGIVSWSCPSFSCTGILIGISNTDLSDELNPAMRLTKTHTYKKVILLFSIRVMVVAVQQP